jgi:glycosyltransferase involved in cell wall biosynthesis
VRVAVGAVASVLGGPATYAVELLRALAATFPGDDWTALTDAPQHFEGVCEAVHVPLGSAWRQPLWDHRDIRRVLARGSWDLYHGTKGVLPWFSSTPSVVTIHDLASRVQPETFRLAQRLHLAVETPAALARARAVITDSEHSAADIRRFYPSAAARIEVVPLAACGELRPASPAAAAAFRQRHGLSGTLVGYLGTIQPRKRLDLLADVFQRARAGRPWTLVIAGRCRPGYRPAVLDSSDPAIRYLGPIDADEVAPFFASMVCMVSPSSYEGFGLSFLEAMACGCPVVGVHTSSVPEVVGRAGVLVAEGDREALVEAVRRLGLDESWRRELRQAGLERAGLFSWEATARATRAIYARVLGEGDG